MLLQPEGYKFITTIQGIRLLMIRNHTFSLSSRSKTLYYCSKKVRKHCKCSVRLTEDGAVFVRGEHTHGPPLYRQLPGDVSDYKFIQTIHGKTLLMVNGYTYTENNRAKNTYYCSRKYKSCKSSIKFDDNGKITSVRLDHNHCPPIYKPTHNGLYFKCSTDQNPSMYTDIPVHSIFGRRETSGQPIHKRLS
uniref:SFRICE_011212 n=1 Tax=Spodoptera frugiperda TaxID=7108 RepID=A0A2H1VRH9_SPOFR